MYTAPIQDMMFLLRDVIKVDSLPDVDQAELDPGTIEAILEEAGKLASGVLALINKSGDEEGCTLKDGELSTAKGFKEAYKLYQETGWNSVPFNPDFGGQGLPWVMAFAIQEMWQAANMSFGLCPLLNQGAVEALDSHGSDDLKATYLEKLISGEWTGTMNLTEPQAGSDLGALKTKAVPQDNGTYKISGQKIYITYGEHDFTPNIIHLVLARVPDAPEGSKGISLFVVPKFMVNDDGSLGERNDVICTGIEHKLGINASPTCTMQFGDKGGATGYLIGEVNQGLKYMFTMMNNARLCVGLQGVAISDRAYQHALSYAKERVQGGGPIINHPDVNRMLMTMKSLTQAGRVMAYQAAYYLDSGDRNKVDILTPIVKSWCTDRSVEVASLGVQVHGGMGFVEETGAAQYYRDARILPIYEGTNGIQALDLHGRKLLRDSGAGISAYLDELSKAAGALSNHSSALLAALKDLKEATQAMLTLDFQDGAALNTYYLEMFGYILGAYYLAGELEASIPDNDFMIDKMQTAEFYIQHILPRFKIYADILKR